MPHRILKGTGIPIPPLSYRDNEVSLSPRPATKLLEIKPVVYGSTIHVPQSADGGALKIDELTSIASKASSFDVRVVPIAFGLLGVGAQITFNALVMNIVWFQAFLGAEALANFGLCVFTSSTLLMIGLLVVSKFNPTVSIT